MESILVESKKYDSFIEFIIDDENIVWIERHHFDGQNEESIKDFFDLIHQGIEMMKLEEKEYFAQIVDREEWEKYLKNNDRWELLEEISDNLVKIMCGINEAYECIVNGFVN